MIEGKYEFKLYFLVVPWSWILTLEQGFFYTNPDGFSLPEK